MPVPRHVRISPREKCDTCELLPGRTSSATHASFSWGEMRHMRVSPQEKCDTCEFLPGRNATRASFPPGEMQQVRISPQQGIHTYYRILPGRNPKISELSWPAEQLQTACDFSRGEEQHMRVSPREKCDTCEFLPGRNATGAHFSPGEIHTMSYRIFPREKSKNLGIVMASGARNATHASFSPGVMRHMRVSPWVKSKQLKQVERVEKQPERIFTQWPSKPKKKCYQAQKLL